MSDRAAFLYTAFDSMFSAKFCGSKAADFCGSTSNGLCLLMSAKDVTETLTGYDQIFRRVMKKLQAGASPVQSILFLVKSDSGSADNSEAITNEIKTRMSEIWSDYDGQVSGQVCIFTSPSPDLSLAFSASLISNCHACCTYRVLKTAYR
jgi:hypothetical protein